MNNNEFLKEMFSYIDDRYKEFSTISKEIEDILYYFHDFCEKHDLKYFLFYGTLLGLTRDKGIIPWDHDIDVCMPYEDYLKLEKIFNDDNNEYFMVSGLTVSNWSCFEAHIGKKGCDINKVHLDIFIVLGFNKINKLQIKILKKLIKFKFFSYYARTYTCGNKYKQSIYRLKYYLISLFLPNNFYTYIFKKLYKKNTYEKHNIVVPIFENLYIFDKNLLEPLKKIEINGKELMYPNKKEEILGILYSNYLEYLPISERFNEFYYFIESLNINKNKTNYRKQGM